MPDLSTPQLQIVSGGLNLRQSIPATITAKHVIDTVQEAIDRKQRINLSAVITRALADEGGIGEYLKPYATDDVQFYFFTNIRTPNKYEISDPALLFLHKLEQYVLTNEKPLPDESLASWLTPVLSKTPILFLLTRVDLFTKETKEQTSPPSVGTLPSSTAVAKAALSTLISYTVGTNPGTDRQVQTQASIAISSAILALVGELQTFQQKFDSKMTGIGHSLDGIDATLLAFHRELTPVWFRTCENSTICNLEIARLSTAVSYVDAYGVNEHAHKIIAYMKDGEEVTVADNLSEEQCMAVYAEIESHLGSGDVIAIKDIVEIIQAPVDPITKEIQLP